MTIHEWLNSLMPVEGQDHVPVRHRLAELVYRNGGRLVVTGWGAMQAGGIYGWQGLDQEDAVTLIHLAGVVAGFKLACGAGVDEAVNTALKAEWAKLEATP